MSYCFSDRYDKIKIIYQSATTTVTLVRAKDTDELYLMKCVNKHTALSPTNFLEADLLQEMNHPGIPALIEKYEDDDIYAIIEEYFIGDSLEQYLLCYQHISQDTLIQFAIQLCEIIQYLHFHKPNPVLYLDLKPDHIIVCGNEIKLIDFGNANFLSSSGNTFQNFGTKKYAAPEQLSGDALDIRTDVYGIGRILWRMACDTDFLTRLRLFPILVQATWPAMKKRTPDTKTLMFQLQHIGKEKKKKHHRQEHLLKQIAVVGNEHGVGCTHIALALVCYLNRAGFTAYYRDYTGQQVVERILRQNAACIQKDGTVYHEFFRGRLSYGPAVEKTEPPEGIQVVDWGIRQTEPVADAAIYVCSGRSWQKNERLPDWVLSKPAVVLCNHFTLVQAKKFARQLNWHVYCFPYQRNVFFPTTAVCYLFSRMFRKEIV